MRRIQLIAVDLDGTLLDDEKSIHEDNIRALREAQAKGVRLAISSGRMVPRIEPIQDRLGLDCLLVSYNGAKVVGPRSEGRPTVFHQPLAAEVAERLIDFSQEHGLLLNFYFDDTLFAEDGPRRRPFIDIYARRTGAEYALGSLDAYRGRSPTKLILLDDPKACVGHLERFTKELAGRANVTRSDPEYLEFMAPGVHKAHGLEQAAKHYGFDLDGVLAIGDADNDLDMVRDVGLGVAMANASEGTKRVAKYVTERDNNRAGVAEAIDRFVLSPLAR